MRLCEWCEQVHVAIAGHNGRAVRVYLHLLTGTPYWALSGSDLDETLAASRLHIAVGTYTASAKPTAIHADVLATLEAGRRRLESMPEVVHHGGPWLHGRAGRIGR